MSGNFDVTNASASRGGNPHPSHKRLDFQEITLETIPNQSLTCKQPLYRSVGSALSQSHPSSSPDSISDEAERDDTYSFSTDPVYWGTWGWPIAMVHCDDGYYRRFHNPHGSFKSRSGTVSGIGWERHAHAGCAELDEVWERGSPSSEPASRYSQDASVDPEAVFRCLSGEIPAEQVAGDAKESKYRRIKGMFFISGPSDPSLGLGVLNPFIGYRVGEPCNAPTDLSPTRHGPQPSSLT